MKKLLTIFALVFTTFGIAGCGNSAPKSVTLTPENGEYQMLEVGKDIAPGTYNLISEGDNYFSLSTQGDQCYSMNRAAVAEQKSASGIVGAFGCEIDPKDKIDLKENDILFVAVNGKVILKK